MFYCGIDIAKNKHYACVVDSHGLEIVSAFGFDNSKDGFDLFRNKLKDIDLSNTLFGMEATGHYGDNLICFLYNKSFKVGIINPIQTNALRKMNIRKTKTDKVDTYLIIDRLFPELPKFFKGNLHLNVSYTLLNKYPSPEDIKKARTTTLANLLSKASRGRYSTKEAEILKDLTKNSIGINNSSLSIQIKLLLKQIYLLNEQIDEVDLKTKSIMDELDSVILSIPGIGYTLGAIIPQKWLLGSIIMLF